MMPLVRQDTQFCITKTFDLFSPVGQAFFFTEIYDSINIDSISMMLVGLTCSLIILELFAGEQKVRS